MAPPLLTTKLFPPPRRTQLVRRLRLIERLENGFKQRCKLALVSAPAGFGKTTLVVEAAHDLGCRLAWVSLDSADNDLARFWRYVIAALQKIHPQAGELAGAMLDQNQPPPIETVLTGLLNDLVTINNPLLLVLDDYHVVETQAIHDSLNFFIDHLSPQVFLVITTRADPPLALARRRSRMEMVEVRASDLRFTRDEALVFLNQTMLLGLPAGEVETLLRRTEGWIAGLQMVALAMRGLELDSAGSGERDRPLELARKAFIDTFDGSDQYIGDYLIEEVLLRQPQPVQDFLLQTSILNRLCASLCDTVTRGAGGENEAGAVEGAPILAVFPNSRTLPGHSQEILSYLERANLFVVPLDNRQEWFRYHRLFADLLQRRLARLAAPEMVRELHRRASLWYAQRELWTEAVDHALTAGDEERAVDLVEQCRAEMFRRSEIVTFREWILRLPQELVLSRPSLCIAWGWAALSTGHADETVRAVEAVEQTTGLTVNSLAGGEASFAQMPEGVALLLVNLAVLRASVDMTRLDFQNAIRRSQQVLESLAYYQGKNLTFAAQDFSSVAYFVLGGAYEALGLTEQSAEAYERAVQDSRASGNLHILPMAISHLAQIQVVRGRLKEAAQTYQQAMETAAQITGHPSPLVSVAHAGLGTLLYEWNTLEEARMHFERTLDLGKPWNNWESLLAAYIGLARVHVAIGSPEQAVILLDEADLGWKQVYRQASNLSFMAWKALILDDADLIERAADHFERAGPPLEAFLAQASEMEQFLRARLWLRLKQWEKAKSILVPGQEKAWSGERWGTLVQNLILQSILMLNQNATEQAFSFMEQALALAEPGGYIRSFVDEGAPAARLLVSISGYGGDKEPLARHAAWLLAHFPAGVGKPQIQSGREQQPQNLPGQQVLVEPLTGREIEILRLIALGLTNSAIAARLVIAPGTVKVHTNNIYAKLGVSSRTAAVARARLLGILA